MEPVVHQHALGADYYVKLPWFTFIYAYGRWGSRGDVNSQQQFIRAINYIMSLKDIVFIF